MASGGVANGTRDGEAANLFLRNGAAPRPAPPPSAPATSPAYPSPPAVHTGDTRQRLHLSLGGNGGSAPGNGNGHPPESQSLGERPNHPPPQPVEHNRNGRELFSVGNGRPPAQMPRENGDSARRGDNAAFIDHELRSRVDGDIAAFLAAFDAALAADTLESRFGLREATDRLLRAGARTRIELERLEARVPLTPRESGGPIDPGAWRHR